VEDLEDEEEEEDEALPPEDTEERYDLYI